MLQEKGIIYCATGKKFFIEEAKKSARTVKQFNNDVPISIFIDKDNNFEDPENLFDLKFIIDEPEFSFADKLKAMKRSPYKKTIYFDCDIVVSDNVEELFNVVEEHDIALVTIPFKNKFYEPDFFQAGFITYRNTEKVIAFLEYWDDIYDRNVWTPSTGDQYFLKQAILDSKLSVFQLPAEYNFRAPLICYAQDRIKIFHCHHLTNMEPKKRDRLIKFFNKYPKERIWFPGRGIVSIKKTITSRMLSFIEGLILRRIKNNARIKRIYDKIHEYLQNKNLTKQRFVLYQFPLLLNWTVPRDYRSSMKVFKKEVQRFIK